LLAALKLPAPYERLRESKRRRGESPPPPTGHSRGRGGGGARLLAAEIVPAAIAIHERVDAIHYIHSRELIMLRSAVPQILSAETATAPAFAKFPRLAESITALTQRRQNSQTFTYNAFATLNAAFGLAFREDDLGTLLSDRLLHEQVTRWRSNATTEIVLDGIVTSPDDPEHVDMPSHECTSRIARSQALCAFVMLLLADYDPALAELADVASAATAPSVVQFLTGPFQTMDIPNWRVYMTRWTGYIQRAAPRIWKRIGLREIAPPIRSASGAEILASSVRLPNGSVVPFRAPRTAPRPDEAAAGERIGAAAFAPTFAVSANKEWFRSLFDEYGVVSDAQRAEMEPLIDNAIAVNALRDALKADIALARGAVYVTYDRLALMYYALRRTAESRGDGLWLYASGIGDAKLGVYE
jgi:hypothetical protein